MSCIFFQKLYLEYIFENYDNLPNEMCIRGANQARKTSFGFFWYFDLCLFYFILIFI